MIRKLLVAMVIVGLVGSFAVAAWAWWSLATPMGGSDQPVSFTVKPGERSIDIANRLEVDGFIRSAWALIAYARLTRQPLLPGIYTLHANGSAVENVAPILAGTIAERQVTIPEGLRLNEIAQLLEEKDVVKAQDFLAAATYNPSLVALPESYDLKADTFLEGFLFPDTYRVPADATANDIFQRMLTNYVTRTKNLTIDYETLIIASIVEREAKFDEDRALVAGVFVNRHQIGMPLQADSTVQYAKATSLCGSMSLISCTQSAWWSVVSGTDLQIDSPYNTYATKELPPRPISNPGLASIEAAVHPNTADNYLYFITDSTGRAHFAKTLAEHNANVTKYLRSQ